MERLHHLTGHELEGEFDLLTVGGGFAGVATAISAAREGKKVLLAERYGFLGGTATAAMVNAFCRFRERKSERIVNTGIFTELLEKVYREGGSDELYSRHFEDETLKRVLEETAIEAGVTVLYHATLCDIVADGRNLKAAVFMTAEGKLTVRAKAFADASGNADLAALAGCEYYAGRESDGLCQAMTLCARFSDVDLTLFSMDEAKSIWREHFEKGEFKNGCGNILLYKLPFGGGIIHTNATRILGKNPLDALSLSEAETEGRAQAKELLAFFRTYVPGMENARLLSTGIDIGIRESRRIDGLYKMTVEDVLGTKKFPDSIAEGAFKVDIHDPTGSRILGDEIPECDYYTIPLRSLIPKAFDNLLVVGRCICSTHEALAAVRIMPIVCSMGEGAGKALAVMLEKGCKTSEIPIDEVHRRLSAVGALY